MRFELLCIEGVLFSEEVYAVYLSGEEGDFGVFAGHAPLVARLRPGIARVVQEQKKFFFLAGGFAEVFQKDVVVFAKKAFGLPPDPQSWKEKIAAETDEDVDALITAQNF